MFVTFVKRFSCYDVVDPWLALCYGFMQLAPDTSDFDTLSPRSSKAFRSRKVLGKDEIAIYFDPVY